MQPLARDGLTTAQVFELLTGQGITRGFGLELLDAGAWADISEDCRGFTVSRDNGAEVHGSLRLRLERPLPWGQARVRPYRTLSRSDIGTARFNRGVFVLTTPDTVHGRNPKMYEVSGPDVVHDLDRRIGDTFRLGDAVDGPTPTYLDALRSLLAAAGITGTVLLDGDRQGTLLPEPRVWGLPANPRWLDVANDLLAEIGYVDLFADENGTYRSRPIRDVATAPVEWVFDRADPHTDVTGAEASETQDLWAGLNSWRFVRRGMDIEPVEGAGVYTVVNQSDGLASVDSVGERWAPVEYLDVADQAALVAEGDRIVAADRRTEQTIDLTCDPLPHAGHADVVEVVLDGQHIKAKAASWTEPSEGRSSWTLSGGAGGGVRDRAEQSSSGTVTGAAPLRVRLDGAVQDSLANALDAATYAVGDRVRVTVRNPRLPLIEGKETT